MAQPVTETITDKKTGEPLISAVAQIARFKKGFTGFQLLIAVPEQR